MAIKTTLPHHVTPVGHKPASDDYDAGYAAALADVVKKLRTMAVWFDEEDDIGEAHARCMFVALMTAADAVERGEVKRG